MQPARLPPQRHLIISHSLGFRDSDFVILRMFFDNPSFVSWQEMPEFAILPPNTRKDAKEVEPTFG
jgi:hypothetical protein